MTAAETFAPRIERFRVGPVPVLLLRGTEDGRRPLVLFHHGSAASKESDLAVYLRLAARGYVVAAADAPYHGERAAVVKPSFPRIWLSALETAARETRLLLDALLDRSDVDRRRVAVAGKSMGSFRAALGAADDDRIRALVSLIGGGDYRLLLSRSESPDLKALPVARLFRAGVGRRLDALDPIRHAARLARLPVLLLAGAEDATVPPECAEALAAAVRRSGGRADLRIFPGAPHRIVPEMEAESFRFLDAALGVPASEEGAA